SGAHSPPSRRITVSTGASARVGPWTSTIPPSTRADERPHPHAACDPASSNVSSQAKQYSHFTGVGASMSVTAITSVDVRPGEQGGGGAPDRTVNLLGPPARRPSGADGMWVPGRSGGQKRPWRRAPSRERSGVRERQTLVEPGQDEHAVDDVGPPDDRERSVLFDRSRVRRQDEPQPGRVH